MLDPDVIQREVLPAMARALFANIDPDARYLVVAEGGAAFTTARLIHGLPANLIGDRDRGLKPLHNHGIYRITQDGIQHDCIADGWVNAVLEEGAGVVRLGEQLTVGEIWDAAAHEVEMRLPDPEA